MTEVDLHAVHHSATPIRHEQTVIFTVEHHGQIAVVVDATLQIRTDFLAEDVANHGDRLGGGDPVTTLEFRGNSFITERSGDLGPTSVHHDGFHPDGGKKDHVVGEGVQKSVIHHGVATQFDHEDAALETTNPGQGLGQGSRFDEGVLVGHGCGVHG